MLYSIKWFQIMLQQPLRNDRKDVCKVRKDVSNVRKDVSNVSSEWLLYLE